MRTRTAFAVLTGSAVALAAPGLAQASSHLALTRPAATADTAGIALVADTGRALRMITRRDRWADGQAAWSPDGTTVAFRRADSDWTTAHLYTVSARGGQARRLTTGRFDESPAWSPDGRRIAYRSLPRIVDKGCDRGAIFVVGSRGGRPRRVIGTNGATHPTWAEDGRRLAFEQGGHVWVARADGRRRKDLGPGSAPAWSPDGRRIAFVSGRGMKRDIALMRSDGSRRRVLMRNAFTDDNPAWAPDGTRLAYDSVRGPDHSTYVLDVDSGRERRLVRMALEPAWRP